MPAKRKNDASLDLNPEFLKAFDLAEKQHKNLFLTGRAGTGKSTFLQYFVQNTDKHCVVLAPTGVAALNVDGSTIHAFFRFTPQITQQEVIKKARSSKKDPLYTQLDLIIVDEISMVRADLFDSMDLFLRTARASREPFGGVQMLLIGDLYQLPPVVKSKEKKFFSEVYQSPFFFGSHVIRESGFALEFVELEKIYRQKDQKFIDILNAARNNTLADKLLKRLNTRVDPDFENQDYITLTPTNDLADAINRRELGKLKSKAKTYVASVRGDFRAGSFPTEQELKLKPGTRVMLLNNDASGLWVNGSIGDIVALHDDYVEVRLDDGSEVEVEPYKWEVKQYVFDPKAGQLSSEPVGSFRQLPMRLAWAVTIHKSQGKTFDRVIVDTGRGMFAHGQAYVALSRCRTLEGMVLRKPFKKNNLWVDWQVIKFLTGFQYAISEKAVSLEDKVALLKKAKKAKLPVKITYLKAKDVKSKRTIMVKRIGTEEYMDKKFLGVTAYCLLRKQERVFRVDRILEMEVGE